MDPITTFRQTNIIFYALLAGQILFCLVILFAISDPETRQSGWPAFPFGMILPIVMASIVGAVFVINRWRGQRSVASGNGAKFNNYRTIVLLRSALIEGVNLFSLVLFLVENNATYLIFFGFGLLLFLYFRPSMDEFRQFYDVGI